MSLIDVTFPLREGTPEWPGDTAYSCRWTWRMAAGASVNVSAVTASPHVGTHADAPLHVDDAWSGSHDLPLDAFMGRATVVSVGLEAGEVQIPDLGTAGARGVERLLLRTGRTIGDGRFPDDWPVLSLACVTLLLDRGLRLVGVDAPSVDPRESKDLPVHRALFARGACVLENLDLRTVPDGEYELIALPLRLEGLDAAPVRAALRPLAPT